MDLFLKKSVISKIFLYFIICAAAFPSYSLNTGAEKDIQEKRIRTVTAAACISSGALTGCAHIFWSISGEVDNSTPLYTDILSAAPSIAAGAFTGYMVSMWLSDRMINSCNDSYPIFLLKGIFFSSLSGAVILTSSLLPLFTVSYYTGSIDFNFDSGSGLAGPVFASLTGGPAYGAVFGAFLGSIYSTIIYLMINTGQAF